MIIRKPYAFLIKNFKKIHIVLLLLSLFIAYKLFDIAAFVGEFMSFGVYDAYSNPVSNHISFFTLIALLLLVVGTVALLMLLRYKKKPWKIYLVPLVEYLVLFFVLRMIKSFFVGYNNDIETTDLRMSRDLLMLFLVAQLPAIGIYVMRVFGLDIQKFNFNSDQEFLELSEADREEIEISINVDKNSFKRLYRRLIRNINYFYLEHKGICRIAVVIVVAIVGFNSYKILFVKNRSYSEGQIYGANGYSIIINNSYFTNKDFNGNVISSKSNFVILDLTLKNHASPRKVNVENFHIKNGNTDYVTTRNTYSKEFSDLGETYDSVSELKRDEELNLIIVYKVDKSLNKDKFVLYYQELNNDETLRKIKLNVKDLRSIEEVPTLKLGDEMDIDIYKYKDNVSFDYYEIVDSTEYVTRNCNVSGCTIEANEFLADETFKIMRIEFASSEFDAKNMIDILVKYGKIVYKDSGGKTRTLKYENPIKSKYYGKTIFMKVPNDLAEATDVEFVFTMRNKKYSYKLV